MCSWRTHQIPWASDKSKITNEFRVPNDNTHRLAYKSSPYSVCTQQRYQKTMERTLVFAFKMSSLHWRFTHNTALLQTVLAYQPTVHPYTQRSKGRHLPTCTPTHILAASRGSRSSHTNQSHDIHSHTIIKLSLSYCTRIFLYPFYFAVM